MRSPKIHQRWLVAKTTEAEGVTGDRSSVGLFIQLPKEIAKQFPSLGENDSSPTHVTFLIVGEIPKDREVEFLEIVGSVVGEVRGPVAASLMGVDYFLNPGKERTVAYAPIRFSHDLALIRSKLCDRLREAGFQIQDINPQVYFPHATLAYMEGLGSIWKGSPPQGDWRFTGIDVWGLPKIHTLPFWQGRAASLIVAKRYLSSGLVLKNEAGVSPEEFASARNALVKYLRTSRGDSFEEQAASRYQFRLTRIRAYSGNATTYRFELEPIGGQSTQTEWGTPIKVFPTPKAALEAIPAHPGSAYRGMSWEEWQATQSAGMLQSRGTHNLGQGQEGLTFFSLDPDTARSYAAGFAPWMYQPGAERPGVIVEVQTQGLLTHTDRPQDIPEEELASDRPIPLREIQSVWLVVPTQIRPGFLEVVYELSTGKVGEGSRATPTVSYGLVKQGNKRIGGAQVFDVVSVENLRKEFLGLVKEAVKAQDYKTAKQLDEHTLQYRNHFEEIFFTRLIKKWLWEVDEPDRSYYKKKLSKIGWDFRLELSVPLDFPDDYYSETARYAQFDQYRVKWLNRLKGKARIVWTALQDFIRWWENRSTSKITLQIPDETDEIIEGFKVHIKMDSSFYLNPKGLEVLRGALKDYRERAAKYVPWVLEHELPMLFTSDCDLDAAGEYHGNGVIDICLSSVFPNRKQGANWAVHIIAHEMGHHLYATGLNKEEQKIWREAIQGDFGTLDLKHLLSVWPESIRDLWDLEEHFEVSDPILATQIDYAFHESNPLRPYLDGKGLDALAERTAIERLVQDGVTEVIVPKSPITGYASKNSEEAFADAIGKLIAYGPTALHPNVQGWLEKIVPGLRLKEARVASRYLAKKVSHAR